MTHCSSARSTSHRNGADGFLLTETLATFTISACVLLGLASVTTVLLRAVDRSIAQSQDVDDLSRTIDAIVRDISGLARARWDGLEPQAFVFRGGPNSLFFARTQRDRDGLEETRVVALREIVFEHTTHLMRSEARISARATGFDSLKYEAARELGTGPVRLRFYYVPVVADSVPKSPLDAWPEGTILPASVIIEAVEPQMGEVIVSRRIPIYANADIGCLDRDGETVTSISQTPPLTTPPDFCSRSDPDKRFQDQHKAQAGEVSRSATEQKR